MPLCFFHKRKTGCFCTSEAPFLPHRIYFYSRYYSTSVFQELMFFLAKARGVVSNHRSHFSGRGTGQGTAEGASSAFPDFWPHVPGRAMFLADRATRTDSGLFKTHILPSPVRCKEQGDPCDSEHGQHPGLCFCNTVPHEEELRVAPRRNG